MQFFPLNFQPGIQRDGTAFDTQCCTDGQWVRFYNNRARKIGGYKVIVIGNDGVVRNMFSIPKSDGTVDLYCGYSGAIKYINVDKDGNALSDFIDRTPEDFVKNDTNEWSMDLYNYVDFDTGITYPYIIAQVSPTLDNLTSTEVGPVYYGSTLPADSTTPLVPIKDTIGDGILKTSGGILSISSHLLNYGNDGEINWSPSEVNATQIDWPNFSCVTGMKIVAARRMRGGGVPSALFWSINSLIRATINHQADEAERFIFDTIADNITLLSIGSIVVANDLVFWIGQGQFCVYNGTVQILPNTMNSNYFFSRLNMNYATKVWGIYIARFKEVWWFYPADDATECTHVVIFNIELQTWYDTACARSAGDPGLLFQHPFMSASFPFAANDLVSQTDSSNTAIYFHEYGNNFRYQNKDFAIESYFTTNMMNVNEMGGDDSSYALRRIDPDFLGIDKLQCTVDQFAYPQSAPVFSTPYSFYGTGSSYGTPKIDIHHNARIFSLTFSSNEVDGFYQMGKTLIGIDKGPSRPAEGSKS